MRQHLPSGTEALALDEKAKRCQYVRQGQIALTIRLRYEQAE